MLKHCVFLNFKPESTKLDQVRVFEELAGLVTNLTGILSI